MFTVLYNMKRGIYEKRDFICRYNGGIICYA